MPVRERPPRRRRRARPDEARRVPGDRRLRRLPKARAMTPDALIDELQAANLRGRGGAGFPMGRKASLIDRRSGRPTYLVVNADESEPGAFKDREVMARVPHRLIEGCLIAAHAIECKHVFIFIRGEYLAEYEILQARGRRGARRGSVRRLEITVHRGAGAYICGEETALLDCARGQARPAAAAAAVPADRRASTCRRRRSTTCSTIATVPVDHRDRRRRVREDRSRDVAGHRDLLDLRQHRASRQLRARARHADARADLRPRRRRARRARAEGRHPRRLVGACALARRDRRAARLRLARRSSARSSARRR